MLKRANVRDGREPLCAFTELEASPAPPSSLALLLPLNLRLVVSQAAQPYVLLRLSYFLFDVPLIGLQKVLASWQIPPKGLSAGQSE